MLLSSLLFSDALEYVVSTIKVGDLNRAYQLLARADDNLLDANVTTMKKSTETPTTALSSHPCRYSTINIR